MRAAYLLWTMLGTARPLTMNERREPAEAGPATDEAGPGPPTSGTGHPLNQAMQEFEGFDCSVPTDVRMIEAVRPARDCDAVAQVREHRPVEYVFLQKAETTPITVASCSVRMTTHTSYCGVYDHVTTLASIDTQNEPLYISEQDCRAMVETRKYRHFMLGLERDIRLNSTNYLRIQEAGYNDIQASHADCTGGEWAPPDWLRLQWIKHGPHAHQQFYGKKMSGIVRTAHMEVTARLLPGLLTHETQTVTIENDGVHFPGAYPQGSGSHDLKQYIWSITNDDCRFFVVRERVTGEEFVTDQGTVFQAGGDVLVRLVKRDPVQACGAMVATTNFPRAFLGDPKDLSRFGQELQLREHSTHLFFNIQDSYILNFLQRYVQQTVQEMLQEECRRSSRTEEEEYATMVARQMALTAGSTARIEENRFAQAAGESFAIFSCRPIVATIRVTEKCYNVIPVFLQPEDEARYKRQRGLVNDTLEFFLEPKGRMLTTIAAEEPCAELLRPIFRNKLGYWVTGGARIELVGHPAKMSAEDQLGRGLQMIKEVTFEENGWYTPQSIRNLDRYRMISQTTAAVTRRLGFQSQSRGSGPLGQVTADSLFPEVPNFQDWMPRLNIVGTIWQWLKDWGVLCSAAVGLYVLVRILYWAFWVAARLSSKREGASWASHIAGALFPNYHDFAAKSGTRKPGKKVAAFLQGRRAENRGTADTTELQLPRIQTGGLYPEVPPGARWAWPPNTPWGLSWQWGRTPRFERKRPAAGPAGDEVGAVEGDRHHDSPSSTRANAPPSPSPHPDRAAGLDRE